MAKRGWHLKSSRPTLAYKVLGVSELAGYPVSRPPPPSLVLSTKSLGIIVRSSLMSAPMPEPPLPPPGFKPPPTPTDAHPQPPLYQQSFPPTFANFTSSYQHYNQQQPEPSQHQPHQRHMFQHNPYNPYTQQQDHILSSPTFAQPPFAPPMQRYGPPIPGPVVNRGRDLFDTKVPPDSFGLIGEILLCPFKVTLALLLALMRKEER